MKTIIAGSRTISDFLVVCKAIEECPFSNEITEIVSGGAMGVDKLAERFASTFKVPFKEFKADWAKYDKAAGPIRNKKMAKYADALIAIIQGNSRGTLNMIDQARQNKLKVFVYTVPLDQQEDEEEVEKPKKYISGFCDACGQHSDKLTVILSRNVAGLCYCEECSN